MFKNYKEELVRLTEKHLKLKREYDKLEEEHMILRAKYLDEVQVNSSLTKRIEEVSIDFEEFLQRYENVITSPEYYNKEREDYISTLKRQSSRAYNAGRQDAFAQMGIRAIEAHKNGNELAILENGEIVELITDLETISPQAGEEEIEIDDLVDVV